MEGACILTSNHLTMLDPPLTYASSPRWLYALAAAKYKNQHIYGLTATWGRSVFVRRGEFDRQSLNQCLAILNAQHLLYIPIEGTRSKTGALIAGKSGVAYLATRTNAPIVPVAVWGVEQVLPNLRRGRRVDVHIHFGEPMTLVEGRARGTQLDSYTDEIMTTLASMLPDDYRGVYADHPMTLQKLSIEH